MRIREQMNKSRFGLVTLTPLLLESTLLKTLADGLMSVDINTNPANMILKFADSEDGAVANVVNSLASIRNSYIRLEQQIRGGETTRSINAYNCRVINTQYELNYGKNEPCVFVVHFAVERITFNTTN